MKFTDKALDGLHRDLKDLENKKKQEKEKRQEIRIRIPQIIQFCIEGIIERPNGYLTLKCPKCKCELEITNLHINNKWNVPVKQTYYICPSESCEYEYAVEKTRS